MSACVPGGNQSEDEVNADEKAAVQSPDPTKESAAASTPSVLPENDETLAAVEPTAIPEQAELAEPTASAVPAGTSSPVRLTIVSQAPVLIQREIEVEKTPVMEEIPQRIMDLLRADVIMKTGVQQEMVTQNRSQTATWSDGSLGCGQPGQMYTQALIPGYWVVLEVNGETYDYRVSESGNFKLCDRPQPLIDPPDTSGRVDR